MPKPRNAGVRNRSPVTRGSLFWLAAIAAFLFVLSLTLLIGAASSEAATSVGNLLLLAGVGLCFLITFLVAFDLILDWRTRKRYQRILQRQRILRQLRKAKEAHPSPASPSKSKGP